jgi:MFS family permease
MHVPRPADISGLASLAGFPISILVAECALRWGPQAIVLVCIGSVLVLFALAATAGGSSLVILPLLISAQIASLADASALQSGAVAASDPARRGAALALFAFIGYVAAFIGPVAVGIVLDRFGGAGSPLGWSAAFITMALGSTAAAWAMRSARKDPGGGHAVSVQLSPARRRPTRIGGARIDNADLISSRIPEGRTMRRPSISRSSAASSRAAGPYQMPVRSGPGGRAPL